MTLFDCVPRSDTRPKRENEPLFAYYNSSDRNSVSAIREILEAWYRDFPDAGKPDVRARFRSGTDVQHQAAFFELYLHRLLRCCGLEVQVHPETESDVGTHPDFLVLKSNTPVAYVEATLASRSREEAGQQARIAQVYDTLNELNSPNFFLGLRLRGAPDSPPPGARVRGQLERWLAGLDPARVARQLAEEGIDGLPTYHWTPAGWDVLFFPIPKSAEARGALGARPIGVTMPELRILENHRAVRSAVAEKSAKYGDLGLPLVVAVNVLEDLADDIDIMNGLFGEENVTFRMLADGSVEHAPGRNQDGAWFGRRGPQNRRSSAALVVLGVDPWRIGERTPQLIHHPWALYPLDPSVWPLPQLLPDLAAGRMTERGGRAAREILAVPDLWPMPDADRRRGAALQT